MENGLLADRVNRARIKAGLTSKIRANWTSDKSEDWTSILPLKEPNHQWTILNSKNMNNLQRHSVRTDEKCDRKIIIKL
jgi:hypothetical protein